MLEAAFVAFLVWLFGFCLSLPYWMINEDEKPHWSLLFSALWPLFGAMLVGLVVFDRWRSRRRFRRR